MFEFRNKKKNKKYIYKNGSSYKTIDKKFSMQGMFMRFYGLETIHSNDKSGSRCENGKRERKKKRMCASIFVLTCSCTRGSYDATITTSTIIHGGKNMDGKSNIYIYKFLHISVLWQRGILRSICNKPNPARNGNDGSVFRYGDANERK